MTLRKGLKPLLCLALLAIGTIAPAESRPAGDLASAVAAERRRPPAALLARSAFLARSNLVDVKLSPKGTQVAYLRRRSAAQSLWLLDTAGGKSRQLLRHSEATELHWSADGDWLFLESPRQLFALSPVSRPGAGVMTLLGPEAGRKVLGPDPGSRSAVLVLEEVRSPGSTRPSSWRVLRLAPGAAPRSLFSSRFEIAEYLPGIRRGPAFARLVAGDHFSIVAIGPGGDSKEVLRCVRLEQCFLLSSPAPGELLLTGDVGGNSERLLRLDSSGRLHTVHQDPAGIADISGVVLDPVSGHPLLAEYRSTAFASYALDREVRAHRAVIAQALAGSGFTLALGRGAGARWLVTETDDRLQHPRRHLYDPATRRLREILAETDSRVRRVPEASAARRIPFSYRASDGFLLRGFLTVPPGRDPRRMPLVVNVHGGPWSHVASGYSTIAQFLANRGYAVFEPNFRGSTGHGRAYMLAGGSDFGNGRVQQDIVDGTRFLLAQGIGDPARVGIAGTSFGGYSALLGATFSPDLFRVAVAAMPPTDFGWVMRWQTEREQARGAEGIGLLTSLRLMGIDPRDPALAERLEDESPLANLDRLKRPVLLIAGGADESVPIRSVVHYAARLHALGSGVSLFVDPRSGHRIDRPETQEQYLFLLGRMLATHLGGPAEELPPADIRQKLRRNLRLADANLMAPAPRAGPRT